MGLDFTSCVVILVSVRIIRSQLSLISFLITFSCLPILVLMPLTFSAPILIPFLLLVIYMFWVGEWEIFSWWDWAIGDTDLKVGDRIGKLVMKIGQLVTRIGQWCLRSLQSIVVGGVRCLGSSISKFVCWFVLDRHYDEVEATKRLGGVSGSLEHLSV